MDRLLQILTCCLPCNQLRAALLYVIGSIGQSEYVAVLVWLSGELGLCASNSSLGTAGRAGAKQGSTDIQVSFGFALALGSGIREDR